MTHRLNRWLLTLALLLAIPFYWLMIDNNPGRYAARPLPIAELRRLATTLPGARPSAAQFLVLADCAAFGDLFAAGLGLKRRPLAMVGWFLPVRSGSPILIDGLVGPAEARARRYSTYFPGNAARLAAYALPSVLLLQTTRPLTAPSHDPVVDARGPQALAPGVVAIPAPDYAPGTRLIYVMLANGHELLFAGDIAPLDESWRELRARSLLAAWWLVPQNRASAYRWLATIARWKHEAPGLLVVPGNDDFWLTKPHDPALSDMAVPAAGTSALADRRDDKPLALR